MFRLGSPSQLLRQSSLLKSVRIPRVSPVGIRQYSKSESLVQELQDLKQFTKFVDSNEKVSVIDFYATWCGPCKALEPIFNALAQRVPEVQFGRVDVDEAQDIAQEYGISAMPTCLFFNGGEKIDKIIGANPPKLVQLIQTHGNVDIANR